MIASLIFHDIEMYSDREEDLGRLFAELAEDDEGDELPPIIVLPLEPEDDPFWPVAA